VKTLSASPNDGRAQQGAAVSLWARRPCFSTDFHAPRNST
jgi:hypothetical protein